MSAVVTGAAVAEGTGFLTLNKARHLPMLQVDGRALDVATLWRWGMRGVRGHRLRTARIGGRLCTTSEWVEAFIQQLTDPGTDAGAPQSREAQIARAERETAELDSAGKAA